MRELLQVILPFNPSLFSALPQHKGPRKTPSITSFLTRKRTPLPLPSNPFVKKPHSEVVKSSITSALILNNGVRWVLNVGWSGYGSRLGEKKNTTDARCIRHQIKAQTNLSVLPLVHSSLPPHLPPFFLRLWLGIWPGDLGFQRANPHLPRSSNTGMFYLWLGPDNNLYLEGGVSVFFNVDGLFRINQNEEYHHLSFGGIIGLMGSEAARLLLCTLTFSVLVK